MSYGFDRLVCINPPIDTKSIRQWETRLVEDDCLIIKQLLTNEFVRWGRTVDGRTVYGVDSLLESLNDVLLGDIVEWGGNVGGDRLFYILIQTGNALVIRYRRYLYNVEFTTEISLLAELGEVTKGVRYCQNTGIAGGKKHVFPDDLGIVNRSFGYF